VSSAVSQQQLSFLICYDSFQRREYYKIFLGLPLIILNTQVSPQSPVHTVAEKWDSRRCLAVFCDSCNFLRQCGQAGLLSSNPAWRISRPISIINYYGL